MVGRKVERWVIDKKDFGIVSSFCILNLYGRLNAKAASLFAKQLELKYVWGSRPQSSANAPVGELVKPLPSQGREYRIIPDQEYKWFCGGNGIRWLYEMLL